MAVLTAVNSVLGSPAHAGIDPAAPPATRSSFRFPRTRGDRPRREREAVEIGKVPPHTRG